MSADGTYVNKGSMTAIGVIFPVLVTMSLLLRFYGWRHTSRSIEIDDILIIPAAVCMRCCPKLGASY